MAILQGGNLSTGRLTAKDKSPDNHQSDNVSEHQNVSPPPSHSSAQSVDPACQCSKPNSDYLDHPSRSPVIDDSDGNADKDGLDRLVQDESEFVATHSSFLTFHEVDVKLPSGILHFGKDHNGCSTDHTYGTSKHIVETASFSTLHAATDLEIKANPSFRTKIEQHATFESPVESSLLRANIETKSDILAPTYFKARPMSKDLTQIQNEITIGSEVNLSSLHCIADNPFQNDRLPIWHGPEESKQCQSNKGSKSNLGESLSPTSPASASVCYPPSHANHVQQNTHSPSSPENSQIYGYGYYNLNETGTTVLLVGPVCIIV